MLPAQRASEQEEKARSVPLDFQVLAKQGRARASKLALPRFDALTPIFMPVGTQGALHGLPGPCMPVSAIHAGMQAH